MSGPAARFQFPHRQLSGALNKGVVIPANASASLTIPCAGASIIRIRAKVTGVDTALQAAFLRPDGKTPYTANNPADVPLTDGTESKMDVTVRGEGMLKITIEGDDTLAATIAYIDVMGLPNT